MSQGRYRGVPVVTQTYIHSHNHFEVHLVPLWPCTWATIPSEINLLQHDWPIAAVPPGVCLLCHGLSIATHFDVLQHVLMHSHRCLRVYALPHKIPLQRVPSEVPVPWHRHSHQHRCFKRYLLCYGLVTARLLERSCSHVDLAVGHSPFTLSSQ